MSFQNAVNADLPLAIAGDYATSNPRAAYPAVEGQFVAGAAGVTVALFAWIQADGRTVLNAQPAGGAAPDGFIHREQQALITTYLADNSSLVPAGFPVTLMETGDYFALSTAAATKGQKAFASTTTGAITYGAAGATIAGSVETAFIVKQGALANTLAVIGTP